MANEELWGVIFGAGNPDLQKQHRLYRRLPSPPRGKLCLVPFRGIGGAVMRFRGKRPSNRNPRFCSACDHFIRAHPGGAEVMLSMVGDGVNVVGRLSSAAAQGEALISSATWEAAGESPADLEERELQLKGRTKPLSVRVLRSATRE